MAEQKIFAGHALRRLRRSRQLAQNAMAEMLGISSSYLNLLERNQRPLTAGLMLKLSDRFDFDPRSLIGSDPGGGVDALRRRLQDPLFADLDIDRAELLAWIESAPGTAEAFSRLFDRAERQSEVGGGLLSGEAESVAAVRREIERWRNHFADLDYKAEALAEELRLSGNDPYAALAERLRVTHQLTIRVLPVEVMPDRLRRLDLHARQLQLSEMLDAASRCFQAAFQIAQLEAKDEIDALVNGTHFIDRTSERFFRRHLTNYFAAAVLMPYGRFLRACESTGYDLIILPHRFGVSLEMVAHRLTTLYRVGARGLPFFMIRVDRTGQVSKRYAGASNAMLAEVGGRCPLWKLHHTFDRPGTIVRQLVELEDGSRWFTMARTVKGNGRSSNRVEAEFSIALGLDARLARSLAAAKGIDLDHGPATPIGQGCPSCTRKDCPQRATPPLGRQLVINDRERGLTPFTFDGD